MALQGNRTVSTRPEQRAVAARAGQLARRALPLSWKRRLRSASAAANRGMVGVLDAADRLAFPEAPSAAEHWQRVVMDEAVARHLASLDVASLTAAEISGDAHAERGWRSFTSLDYPAFDLCAPLPEDVGTFDVVICEQVLEHVLHPWAAAANLKGLCRPGGHVVVTSPFLIKVHELPMYGMRDYWRFTPRGLRTLLEQVGLEVDEVHSWGNRECVLGNLSRWSARRRWHSLRDEADIPVQVWAFARNPG